MNTKLCQAEITETKVHLVLELILNWTGKGNCVKAESGPETKFFFIYILKCSDSRDQNNLSSSKKDQILLIAFSAVLPLSACTTAKLENLHKAGMSQYISTVFFKRHKFCHCHNSPLPLQKYQFRPQH